MLASRQTITQVRNSSGKLKELGIRLKSIRNIEKITKTMKMISSAKFAKASKTIGPARAFGEGAQAIGADVSKYNFGEIFLIHKSKKNPIIIQNNLYFIYFWNSFWTLF